jgi:hypothetical protein
MSWTTHLAARPARVARRDFHWRRHFRRPAADNPQPLAIQPELKPNQTKSKNISATNS